jgi:hypothetical protein
MQRCGDARTGEAVGAGFGPAWSGEAVVVRRGAAWHGGHVTEWSGKASPLIIY